MDTRKTIHGSINDLLSTINNLEHENVLLREDRNRMRLDKLKMMHQSGLPLTDECMKEMHTLTRLFDQDFPQSQH